MKLIYKTSTQMSILLVLILVVSFYWWQSKFSSKKIKIDINETNLIPALNIEEAKYTGFSKNGRKFSISAKLITKNPYKTSIINMTEPRASIETSENSILLSSNIGEFDINNKQIFLKNNVSLVDKLMNYKLLSDDLNANLNKSEFSSKTPIHFLIPSGKITSESFIFKKNEKKMLFSGKSKLVINKLY